MAIILNIGSLKISSWIVRWRQHTLSGLSAVENSYTFALGEIERRNDATN